MFYKSLTLICLMLANTALAKTASVQSPNGEIQITVSDEKLHPQYSVSFKGETVIEASRLGMEFKDQANFIENFELVDSKKRSYDENWQQPWGERKVVREHYNELSVEFRAKEKQKRHYKVVFRAFNDGIGFRYQVPKQKRYGKVEITNEITEFRIPNSREVTTWWTPGRAWNRYEYIYNTTPLSEMDRAHTPVTMKLPSGVHLSIHEAALVDYAGMVIDQQRDGHLKADLTPWSDGVLVKTQTPFKTPWRTIHISADAVGLLNSDLILNLNEPNVLGDVSWVEPGKYIGIWWGMHVRENTWGTGDIHGATTSETKRYIDFAAKYNFPGVLVEGWNIGWDGNWYENGDLFNFTKDQPDFNLKEVTDYGKSKNVRLVGHHETSGNVTNYREQMGDAFDLYEKVGIAQVKTGYVADGGKIKRIDDKGIVRYEWHDGQFMVGEYLHSIKEAAKRNISINTHEPIKDTGLRRTYPNWISREGARGQEYNAWGDPANPPEHAAILPYTRMLSGPMDFTPGVFDMGYNGLDSDSRVKTTVAKQLALYVVIYSPIQMAADLPRKYEEKLDAFQFILDVPTDWEDSIALAGEIGDYVVFARKERGGNDWFLGALTDENKRDVEVSLDFLDDGEYLAEIYADGKGANWKTNPYPVSISKKKVSKKDKLKLSMATSGGVAIKFKKL